MKNKAIFIDKDGTLIKDVPYNVNPSLIEFTPYAFEGLKILKKAGFKLIIVSNQSGIARGYFSEQSLAKMIKTIKKILRTKKIEIDGFYYCPHHPNAKIKKYAIKCKCRKPMPGLITKAASDQNIDLSKSFLIGDILNDIEAGRRAPCRTIFMDSGNETEWIVTDLRNPDIICCDLKQAAEEILYEY